MEQLNEAQIMPVTDTDGQLLVVAGAGSGKTRVLTYRIAYLIERKAVDPYHILAITFTNKAANEMKTRVNAMLGGGGLDEDGGYYLASRVWVSTFHSMAARILRGDIDKLGYDRNFSIYADADVERVLKRIMQNKHIEKEEAAKLLSKVRWHISNAKNQGLDPLTYEREMAFSRGEDRITELYTAYEAEMRASNALDFDDLLLKLTELFIGYPEVLEKYAKRFRYVHVDEFQDTNKIQYRLLKLLVSFHGNLFAVGDDDQSIYAFRGADLGNILNFKKDFPEAKIYKLERNYRSTDSILDAANAVIKNNRGRIAKKLWTEAGSGESVIVKENMTDREEADFVIARIDGFLKEGYSLKDMAILVRQNSLTRTFEEKLNLYGYAYKLFGGFKFYERKEIRDVIAYMKMVSNPKDKEAITRIINFPKRGIGDAVLSRLYDYTDRSGLDLIDVILGIENNDEIVGASKVRLTEFKNIVQKLMSAAVELPLGEYVNSLIRVAGFESYYKSQEGEEADRYENIVEFANAVREFEKDNPNAAAEDFLQSVSLVSDTESEDDAERLVVGTIHSVKGLEFKIVFIVGVEEGIFPSERSVSEGGVEEERRVMYVAITRARERLLISYAKSRFRFNEIKYTLPSRFVKELEECGHVSFDRQNRDVFGGYSAQKSGATGTRGGASGGYGGVFGSSGYARNMRNSEFLNPDRAAIERINGQNNYGDTHEKPVFYGGGEKPNAGQGKDFERYKVGAKVFHKRFGEGTIVQTDGFGTDMTAGIAFKGLGIKKFNVSLAPLDLI
ncbi:MAG: UvrD-helicase domain-containing protein [Clostridiales bacterium]|nr:UvrD-helicase domain-containing protein [Clostridiales bacterium]